MANLISCRFEICRKLGQGTYGKVQLGINKETGQQVWRIYNVGFLLWILFDLNFLSNFLGGN